MKTGKERAEEDDEPFRGLAEAEPDDGDRYPGQWGNWAQQVDQWPRQPPQPRIPAGSHAERDAGECAQREAPANAPETDGDVMD